MRSFSCYPTHGLQGSANLGRRSPASPCKASLLSRALSVTTVWGCLLESRLRRPATDRARFPAASSSHRRPAPIRATTSPPPLPPPHRPPTGGRPPFVPPRPPRLCQAANQLAFRLPILGSFPATDDDVEVPVIRPLPLYCRA